MTPAAPAGRPARDLPELEQLEPSERIRYHGRSATVLEVVTSRGILGVDQPVVELEVLFDDRDAPEILIATAENLFAYQILPPPRVYDR